MRRLSAEALWGLAHAAAGGGDPDRAARLAGAASAIGDLAVFDATASVTFAHHLDDARVTLYKEVWQEAWADGAELDLETALTLASGR